MIRFLACLMLMLTLAAPAMADAPAPTLVGFAGKVNVPDGNLDTYTVYLYIGDSSRSDFYAKRRLVASVPADSKGNFIILVPSLSTDGPVTIRAKNAKAHLGGDSVQKPPATGWPILTKVTVSLSPQADPKFGISTNNYAYHSMFFVTDRGANGGDFANDFAGNSTSPSFGTFVGHVALGPGQAASPQCGIAPDWKCDGPQASNEESFVDAVTPTANGRANASAALSAALANPDGNTVLLFVHGYNTTFDGGGATAAQISYLMEPASHATLYYSWPSNANYRGYVADLKNAQISATANLAWVLNTLSALPTHPKIIMVAHSMGAYTLAMALSSWGQSHPSATGTFDDLVLFAGDLDKTQWDLYAPNIDRVVKRVRTYGNEKDLALRLSQCATGDGRQRVGQITDWKIAATPTFSWYDATHVGNADFMGHGYLASSTSVALNWNGVSDSNPLPDQKVQTVKLPWLRDGSGSALWGTVASGACAVWGLLP